MYLFLIYIFIYLSTVSQPSHFQLEWMKTQSGLAQRGIVSEGGLHKTQRWGLRSGWLHVSLCKWQTACHWLAFLTGPCFWSHTLKIQLACEGLFAACPARQLAGPKMQWIQTGMLEWLILFCNSVKVEVLLTIGQLCKNISILLKC